MQMNMPQQIQKASKFPGNVHIAKITHPKSSGELPRSRLFGLLDLCRERPITWISAPAGFGKTTLVSNYISTKKIPSIWYRVDTGDSDIATFFYYMGLTIKKVASRKKSALPLLLPENLLGIHEFTLRYFERFYGCLKPPFVIIFDNYQDVPYGLGFHEVIRQGLEILPEGINAILISREKPPPDFARLQVNRQICFMGADELRFTLEEAVELARLDRNRALSEDELRSIHQKTHGWAAGLMLLMEDAERRDINHDIHVEQNPQRIFDYFASEVFGKMPDEMQAFLIKVSFLPRMTSRKALKLTGNKTSDKILSRLLKGHFFIEKDSGTDPVYRFHPLFRDFLLARARKSLPTGDILRLQHQAADLLIETGQDEEAVSLLLGAGDFGGIISFLLNRAPTLMGQGRIQTLSNWLSRIPQELIEDTPWLLYWSGICKRMASPAESRMCFERAFQLFCDRADEPGTLLSWSGIVDSLIMEQDDFRPLDRWIDWLEKRSISNPLFPSPEIEAAVASSMSGALLWRCPQPSAMKSWINRALSPSPGTGNIFQFLQPRLYALTYYMWTGDHALGGIILDEVKLMAESKSAPPLTLLAFKATEANFALIGDMYERTLQLVSEGLLLADETGVHVLDFMLLGQGAYGALRKGDPGLTSEYASRMKACLQPGQRAGHALYYHIAALQHLFTGQISSALVYAEQSLTLTEETGMAAPEAMSRIVLAQAAYEAGDQDRAARELAKGEEFLRQMRYHLLEFTCGLVRAYFAFDQGDKETGLAALAGAMRLGKNKGYVYAPMLWRPTVWSFLCTKALAAGIEVEYVQELVRRQELYPEDSAAEIENWPYPIKINTLGRFSLIIDGKTATPSGKLQKKPILLLKAIIALGAKDVRGELLADILWPDADGDAAHNAMKTTVARLRRMIGIETAIQVHEGRVSLDDRYCWVDIWAFERLCSRAEQIMEKADENTILSQLVSRAFELYGGPFLHSETDQNWTVNTRERLRSRYLRLISRMARRCEQVNDLEAAAEYYLKGLETEPIAEEFHQGLMTSYIRLGRHAEALGAYKRCREILQAELGITPSARTETLKAEILKARNL